MNKQSANYAPETGAYCDGDGWVLSIFLVKPCPICNGQGSVLVAQPARYCARRGGRGIGGFLPCKACNGYGWAHALPPGH